MIDLIFQFFLAFAHEIVLIPLLACGYLWGDRQSFFSAIVLLFSSMLFNQALKVFFHIPPRLGAPRETFAFPSGHAQSTVLLYQWFWKGLIGHPFLLLFSTIIVLGIFGGLIHFNYHNIWDILGSIVVATILSYVFSDLLRKSEKFFLLSALGLAALSFIYLVSLSSLKPFHYSVFVALSVFILLDRILFPQRTDDAKFFGQKVLASLIYGFLLLVSCFLIKKLSPVCFYAAVSGSLPIALKIALIAYPAKHTFKLKDRFS